VLIVLVVLAGAIIVPATLVAVPSFASAATGSSIATLAVANVGKKACSTNSKGGQAFESSCTGNGGQPEYWCADFARWVWANSGVADTSWLNAAAGSFYTYGEESGTLSATPAVGDAAVFDYYGGGVADHVAIVTEANPNGTVETVSGDWNGDSGSEAHFASTSSVVSNAPAYLGEVGASPAVMGMTISAFVAPVSVTVVPVIGETLLPAGRTLSSGQALTSPNGLYTLDMQSDGDLVEYDASRPLWSTNTAGDSGDRAVMQSDGNLVVYSSSDVALWSSRTGGHSGVFSLSLQDTARMVINGPSGALWSLQPQTGILAMGQTLVAGQRIVSANPLYTLTMQSDGNLVEYTAGRALWSTATGGHTGDRAVMQDDGNLVVYTQSGVPLWSSRTGGRSGTFSLVLQDDADLVINGPSGAIWSNHVSALNMRRLPTSQNRPPGRHVRR
jgi:hypothetical protein